MSQERNGSRNHGMRLAAWMSAFAIVAGSPACLVDPDDDGDVTSPPSPVFPIHHLTPAWSRQGFIAYWDAGIVCVMPNSSYLFNPELMGIWILNPRTGERKRLLEGFWVSPTWSPDGRFVAAVKDPIANPQIWVTPTDSANPMQLTFEGENRAPAWSPDGQWLAYTSNLNDPKGASVIWLMRPDGSEKHDISQHGVGEWVDPSWSTDGAMLLHVRFLDEAYSSEIFVMERNGSGGVRLTYRDATDLSPECSLDGERIAFTSKPRTGSDLLPQIWIMSAAGSFPRQLTTRGGSHPSWSLDGTQIVFTREDWRTNTPGNGALWVVNVETGREYQLLCKWPERCP